MRCLLYISLPFLALAAANTSNPALPVDTCPPKDITALLAGVSHLKCPFPSSDLGYTVPGPWTYQPRCVATNSRTYCVFTSSHFGSNGLSLIADPQAASRSTPILADIYHSSFPSSSSARNLNLEPAFGVRDVTGKGKGLVATRHIKAKETFLLDSASLIVEDSFTQNMRGDERWIMMSEAVDRLIDPGVVTGLGTMGRSENAVEDVLQTNNFKSELEIGRSSVLFPLISRINHACKPNAFIRHSSSGIVAGVAAFRDIQPGEEITISYIPLQEPSESRKSRLEKTWGFNCTCSLCTSPPATLAANDAVRSSLQELEGEAISAINVRNFSAAMEKLTKLAEGLEEEGLWPLLQDIYQVLATVSWLMGDREETEQYIVRKLDIRDDYGRLEVGDRGAELVEEMKWIGKR